MLDITRLDRAFHTSLLCKTLIFRSVFLFFHDRTSRLFPRRLREGGEVSIAVPIILAVALAVSLSGQVGRFWPNYQSEQDEKSDKQDESKDKSDKGEEKPSEKSKSGHGNSSNNKPGKSDRNSSTATSERQTRHRIERAGTESREH
jgi:hypothetical protein